MRALTLLLICVISLELNAQFTVKDRHGNVYPTITLDNGDVWLGRDLSVRVDGSFCWLNKDDQSCKNNGRLYTLNAAIAACQNLGIDWQLPGWSDWDYLRKLYNPEPLEKYTYYQMQTAQYLALALGGESGLDLTFSGYVSPTAKPPKLSDFKEGNTIGSYWCMYPRNTSKAITFNVHRNDRQFFEKIYPGRTGISVRCIMKKK